MNENGSKKETKASWFGAHMSGAELDFPSQLQIQALNPLQVFHFPLSAGCWEKPCSECFVLHPSEKRS